MRRLEGWVSCLFFSRGVFFIFEMDSRSWCNSPVTTTTLPAVELIGLVGSIASYTERWTTLV
jgi:hypothetical protein